MVQALPVRAGLVRFTSLVVAVLLMAPAVLWPRTVAADSPPVIGTPAWLQPTGSGLQVYSPEGANVSMTVTATGVPAPVLSLSGFDGNWVGSVQFTTSTSGDTTTGVIQGVLGTDSAGDHPITITATNASGSATLAYNWHIGGVPGPDIRVDLTPTTAIYGDPITVLATVSSNGWPALSGTVYFSLNGSALTQPVQVNNQGQVSATLTNLPVGNLTIRADYSGGQASNGDPLQANFGSGTLRVGPIPTTTTAGGNPNPALPTQTIVFNAQVTSPKLSAVNVGTVDFVRVLPDNTLLNIGSPLVDANGRATLVVGMLPVGLHPIRVNYSGTTTIASSSTSFIQVVGLNPSTVSVSSTANPAEIGTPVTISAAVSANGTPVTAGTVTFSEGSTTLATVPVDASGRAGFSTSSLTVGNHPIAATYSGIAGQVDPGAGTLTQVVTAHPTSLSLTGSPNPAGPGAAVTFTATVTHSGAPVTSGSVVFTEGSTVLAGPVGVNGSGQASFTTASLPLGNHIIQAQYGGGGDYLPSGASLTQTVAQAGLSVTTATLASSANPSNVGQPVTFTVTVKSAGTPVTSGTVTIMDNGNQIAGPVVLDAQGQVSVTTSSLAAGAHNLQAVYSGTIPVPGVSNGYAAGTGSLTQMVNAPGALGTTITFTSTANPSSVGQAVTITATVATTGGAAAGAGAVTFYEGAVALTGPVPVDGNGRAAFTTSSLGAGDHTITAVYSGATGFAASTGTYTQVVNASGGSGLTGQAQALCTLIAQYVADGSITNHGVANSLQVKCDHALGNIQKAKYHAASGDLTALIQELEAQSGKFVRPAAASDMIVKARELLAALP